MKKSLAIILLLLCFTLSEAQTSGNAVTYTITKGDTWYSVARKFHLTYAELRIANKEISDKLSIGQKIKVPSKLKPNDPYFEKNKMDVPSAKAENNSSSRSTESRLHVVSRSETLFSIAKRYNVSVSDIKEWNHLRSNAISNGQVLTIKIETATPSVPKSDTKPVTETNSADKNPSVPPAPEIPEKAENAKPTPLSTGPAKPIVFANNRKEVNETGVAAWIEDEAINPNKYYALHRTAPIGTIIKVVNRMNSRSVFVKVVGKLPQTGDNEGLIIKISKAGAEKLGVLDARFQTQLIYGISDVASNK
jgi:LysM repeat protein